MYLDFTTKQLKEYNKLIKFIESCTNAIHHTNTINIIKSFGKTCDCRKYILKKQAIIKLLKFDISGWDEYNKYCNATIEQVQSLIDYSNYWLEQFEAWENEQLLQKQEDERENNQKKRIKIQGFANVLKKQRKKI
jgi:hypothetical protein